MDAILCASKSLTGSYSTVKHRTWNLKYNQYTNIITLVVFRGTNAYENGSYEQTRYNMVIMCTIRLSLSWFFFVIRPFNWITLLHYFRQTTCASTIESAVTWLILYTMDSRWKTRWGLENNVRSIDHVYFAKRSPLWPFHINKFEKFCPQCLYFVAILSLMICWFRRFANYKYYDTCYSKTATSES